MPANAIPTSTPPTAATPTAHAVRRIVAVVGDSLAFSAGGLLSPALDAATLIPIFDLAPGRRIPVPNPKLDATAGRDAVRTVAAFQPSLWIIQLGTNDVFYETPDRARYVALVASILDEIGPGVPVVWVNVWRADRAHASGLFNEVLQQTAALDRHLHVADWATVATQEQVLAPDGVHLNQRGVERFSRTVMDTASLALLAG